MDQILDILLNLSGPAPYFLVFGVLLLCGLGLPIPEDITLFAGGLASYYGLTHLWVTILIAYFGVILGDSIIFFLGAIYGKKLTRRWLFHKLLPDERLDAVRIRFHQQGNKLIFVARFMPGLRAPIYFSAGTLHLSYGVFLFYDGIAALLSVPTIIGAVYYFGDELDQVIRVIQKVEHGIFAVILITIGGIFSKWYFNHRRSKKINKGS